MSTANASKNILIIVSWLWTVAGLVLVMAVIGAITRLTESGLSMVEWRPLIGALPPLSDSEWNRVYDLYRQTPEYQKINTGMDIALFKEIFFWEWLHRLWGRLIGLVYALPLLYFWVKGMIPEGYKGKLLIGLLLGGGQAVMGWYMVKSGLVDRPSVSHYRLAAHLGLAFVIYAYLLWLSFSLKGLAHEKTSFCLKRHGWIALGFVTVTIIWGAFVAGLDGGMVYNSWPKMGPYWIPPEMGALPRWISDPVAVQFIHRWLAIATAAIVLLFAARMKSIWLGLAVVLQIALGLSTLLSQVWIPLAALHQFGAFLVIGFLVYHLQALHLASRHGGARLA